jgi:phosphoribosylformylglycinamidine cyclo-ligase
VSGLGRWLRNSLILKISYQALICLNWGIHGVSPRFVLRMVPMIRRKKLTYSQAGVDYSRIDPIKILAQKSARATGPHIAAAGFPEIEASRGESAYVVDAGRFYLASITECLGTKVLVAEPVRQITGRTYFDSLAQDTLAMAINDLITVGARPLTVHAYWALGGNGWLADEPRMRDLIKGWKRTCDDARVSWGGGETPVLSGVVCTGTVDLAASCVGIIRPKSRLSLGAKLAAGDAIVILESSGIHANGVTLARKLAERLPEGYATGLNDGRLYGEALLDPTIIYSPLIEALFAARIKLHYMSNITGHGWRKIMRHSAAFTYRITQVPPVPPVLRLIQEQAQLDSAEAYGSLNMGAGFALFMPPSDAPQAIRIAARHKIKAYLAGYVEDGPRQVILEPVGVNFKGASLNLRA